MKLKLDDVTALGPDILTAVKVRGPGGHDVWNLGFKSEVQHGILGGLERVEVFGGNMVWRARDELHTVELD